MMTLWQSNVTAVSKRYRYGLGAFACRVGGTKNAFGAFDAWPKKSATWQFRNGIDMALVPSLQSCWYQKGVFGGFDAWPKSATWQFRNGIDMALVPLHAGLGHQQFETI